ncbi:ATP-binding protein (plasmid) [Embleya sp. NBC_00888]|uniref:ATP-binding protein n=1 Tax=Embleya sp. NBC_00888 TaxID=2975960 RepID=UPI002F9098C9|nr:ATP-binding protein [Embleya sp. NBC_00888]
MIALPARDVRVADARRFTGAVLARWGLVGDDRDSAVLIVGELAANAAQYGRSVMTVRLVLDAGVLDIAVDDHGDHGARRRPRVCNSEERGRGMDIVEFLAGRVDVEDCGAGHTVRAMLPVAAPSLDPRATMFRRWRADTARAIPAHKTLL